VSGDPIVRLPAHGDGTLARLVHAVEVFGQAALPPWVVVGGLAVMVRLAAAHRVTADVDTVADDDAGLVGPALAILAREQHGTLTGSRFVLEDGTSVDVITTGSWTTPELPDDELDRAFILSHWWAVATGEAVGLRVVSGADTVAAASAQVATPAALIACKLQSCRQRRRAPAKAASDIYDIYRLLVEHDGNGAVATALAHGPADLGPWCADALTETLIDDAARSARRLSVSARGPSMGQVSALDLQVVGTLCADRLRAELRR
jgi:hypothetical protein